jgi:hypothetical protein
LEEASSQVENCPANHDHQPLTEGGALSADFDHDPERFAANQLATRAFSIIGDVHDRVTDRLAKITNGPILDLGGGNGVLAKSLARLSTKEASLQARQWNTPLTVTKRGCLIWARRP